MTPAKYKRIRNVFIRVCELSPRDPDAEIARLCSGDAEREREVRSLLEQEASEDVIEPLLAKARRVFVEAALGDTQSNTGAPH